MVESESVLLLKSGHNSVTQRQTTTSSETNLSSEMHIASYKGSCRGYLDVLTYSVTPESEELNLSPAFPKYLGY